MVERGDGFERLLRGNRTRTLIQRHTFGRPFRAGSVVGRNPGLKPWAVFLGPFHGQELAPALKALMTLF